ncbi:MAG: phosphoribosylformylglycinamidine synthase subunit PurS [Actinomycetota bacterium]
MKARVSMDVMLKEGMLDPQGQTVERNLPALGFGGVAGVRIGKHVEFEIEGDSKESIASQVEEMGRRLLSNPVIEDFTYRIDA